MGEVVLAEVTSQPLDLLAHLQAVSRPSAGAVASFHGLVRDHDGGEAVTQLEYQAHPSAGEIIVQIAIEIAAGEGIDCVAISHRVDAVLEIGDIAIVCAVSAAHRGEAFQACEQLVERVKHELPVWKRQTLIDGRQDWVNCP